jgi:hypothetical protein
MAKVSKAFGLQENAASAADCGEKGKRRETGRGKIRKRNREA